MQYILSEEEREKVAKLNMKVLELTCNGKCRKEHGGYCDNCPISGFKGTGTCTEPKSYSK